MSDKTLNAEAIVAEANNLFVDEDFENALLKFDEAIKLIDDNADYFVKRSNCHYKLENYTAALDDTEKAIKLEPTNAKAYFRKGQAAFAMEKYSIAKEAFEKAQELGPSASNKTWIRKCEAELAGGGSSTKDNETKEKDKEVKKPPQTTTPANTTTTTTSTVAPTPTPTPIKPQPRYRHEWFQTATHVNIDVFAKGLKKENIEVNIQKQSVELTIKLPNQSEFQLNFDLADEIIPSESHFSLLSTKIEIKLKKSKPLKWTTLENTGDKPKTWDIVSDNKVENTSLGLNYPTSSKHGAKNWDKLANEQIGEEKLDGDAALNKVFQDIYSGASDDQRRAMQKSFLESGGTVLSTNWDEVGKSYVKGTPPKGLEMKEWKELQN